MNKDYYFLSHLIWWRGCGAVGRVARLMAMMVRIAMIIGCMVLNIYGIKCACFNVYKSICSVFEVAIGVGFMASDFGVFCETVLEVTPSNVRILLASINISEES